MVQVCILFQKVDLLFNPRFRQIPSGVLEETNRELNTMNWLSQNIVMIDERSKLSITLQKGVRRRRKQKLQECAVHHRVKIIGGHALGSRKNLRSENSRLLRFCGLGRSRFEGCMSLMEYRHDRSRRGDACSNSFGFREFTSLSTQCSVRQFVCLTNLLEFGRM